MVTHILEFGFLETRLKIQYFGKLGEGGLDLVFVENYPGFNFINICLKKCQSFKI